MVLSLVSRGADDDMLQYYSVNTDVTKYIVWINDKINRMAGISCNKYETLRLTLIGGSDGRKGVVQVDNGCKTELICGDHVTEKHINFICTEATGKKYGRQVPTKYFKHHASVISMHPVKCTTNGVQECFNVMPDALPCFSGDELL